jgi:hypothetical protein
LNNNGNAIASVWRKWWGRYYAPKSFSIQHSISVYDWYISWYAGYMNSKNLELRLFVEELRSRGYSIPDDINKIPDSIPGMRMYVASFHEIEDEGQIKKPNSSGGSAESLSPLLINVIDAGFTYNLCGKSLQNFNDRRYYDFRRSKTLLSRETVRHLDDLSDPLLWSRVSFISIKENGIWIHIGRHSKHIAFSKGWILPGKTEDEKLQACLAPGTHLNADLTLSIIIKRGGAPLNHTGVYHLPGLGLQPDIENVCLSEEFQCDPYIYYKTALQKRPKVSNHLRRLKCPNCPGGYRYKDFLHDEKVCSRCGATDKIDARFEHPTPVHSR